MSAEQRREAVQSRADRQHHLAALPPFDLPNDRPRSGVPTFQGAIYRFALPSAQREALEILIRQKDQTLPAILLAAFQILLQRYSGQEDFAVVVLHANDGNPSTNDSYGAWSTPLVMHADLKGNPTFDKILRQTQEALRTAASDDYGPSEHRPSNASSYLLFQVMFAFQNTPSAALELPGLRLHAFDVDSTTERLMACLKGEQD